MKKFKLVGLVGLVAVALLLLFSVALAPASTLQAQDGVTGFNTVRVLNFFRAQPRTAVTLTNGGALNPSGTVQRVTAATAVGVSGADITVKPAGTFLTLLNTGSNSITFTETGTLVSAGNIVLGAGDNATLVSDGTNWYQIAASNN